MPRQMELFRFKHRAQRVTNRAFRKQGSSCWNDQLPVYRQRGRWNNLPFQDLPVKSSWCPITPSVQPEIVTRWKVRKCPYVSRSTKAPSVAVLCRGKWSFFASSIERSELRTGPSGNKETPAGMAICPFTGSGAGGTLALSGFSGKKFLVPNHPFGSTGICDPVEGAEMPLRFRLIQNNHVKPSSSFLESGIRLPYKPDGSAVLPTIPNTPCASSETDPKDTPM